LVLPPIMSPLKGQIKDTRATTNQELALEAI
jgi:hypothetical protein